LRLNLRRELNHRIGKGVRISVRGITVLEIKVTGIDRVREKTELEVRNAGQSTVRVLYNSSPPLELIEGVTILQTHIPSPGSSPRTGRTVYVTYDLGKDYFATPQKF